MADAAQLYLRIVAEPCQPAYEEQVARLRAWAGALTGDSKARSLDKKFQSVPRILHDVRALLEDFEDELKDVCNEGPFQTLNGFRHHVTSR